MRRPTRRRRVTATTPAERRDRRRARRERRDHVQRARERRPAAGSRSPARRAARTPPPSSRRPDSLHARPGRQLRRQRVLHGHGARRERDRPGHRRPARHDGGEPRLHLPDRRRARLRRPGDADPRPCRAAARPARSPARPSRSRASSSATTRAAGEFGGYYVQEEDADADADPATSEGIFVFDTASGRVHAGRRRPRPRHGRPSSTALTELTPVTAAAVCSSGASVTPTAVSPPGREPRRPRALRGHARRASTRR